MTVVLLSDSGTTVCTQVRSGDPLNKPMKRAKVNMQSKKRRFIPCSHIDKRDNKDSANPSSPGVRSKLKTKT